MTRGKATLHFPIVKKQVTEDGALVIYGLASDESLDRDSQGLSAPWAAHHLQRWVQDWGGQCWIDHDPDAPPAGKGLDVVVDEEKGESYIRARIAQKDAIAGILDGTYPDLSVGMVDVPVFQDPRYPNGRIGDPAALEEGYIREVSITPLGSNKNSHIVSIGKRANKSAPIVKSGVVADGPDRLTGALAAELRRSERQVAKRVEKAAAAAHWYALVKRDMDPDVGGGVDRDKLPAKAFVFPATRDFPVVTPGDVSDAVSSWGRYKGSESFESFKKKLTALARREGDAFVAELPAAWSDKPKKEKSTMAKQAATKTATDTTKAAGDPTTKAAMPDGAVACKACKSADGDCQKCGGKGFVFPKAKKTATVKDGATAGVKVPIDPDAADDVVDAIGDAEPDDEDKAAKKAAKAVAKAERKAAKLAAAAKGEGSEAVATPAQDGKVKPGKKPLATGDMAAKAADDGKKPPFEGAAEPFGGKKKGKAAKSAEVPYLAVRAHDLVCPAYANKAVKSAYGDVTPAAIDPEFFQKHLASLAGSRKAAPGSIAEASQAFSASVGLVNLAPKSFGEMRRAAHKAWLDANPDMPNLKPGLIDPNTLRRGFLASANSEVAHTTTVPSPDLHPTLTPPDNSRVSPNSLGDGGHSVAKSATMTKGRTFYTSASKDEHAGMAGTIHDWLSDAFPGCCPMVDSPDPTAPAAVVTDTGTGADQVGAGADNTVVAVADASRANKTARKANKTAKEAKQLRKQVASLRRTVKSMASAPDPRSAAVRSHAFARRNGTDPSQAETLAKAKEAAAAIRSRDSAQASEGLDELRALREAGKLTPKQFAQFATAD